MPWRSSSSSASARRSGRPGNSRAGQRPAALGRGHLAGAAAREAARARPLRLRLETATGAERRPGVVRDLARPDEIPERGQRLLGLEPGVEQQVVPEERAAAERGAQPLVDLLLGPVGRGRRAERRRVLAEVERDAVEPRADPDHLAGGAERVELLGPVAGHAARQDVASPRARPAAPGPAAAPAPRAATRGGRSRASSAGSARTRPARRARPRAAARPATPAAGVAGSPGRTTRARCRRAAARRGRARRARSSSRSTGSTSRPKRSFASPVVNGPRERAKRRRSECSGSSSASRKTSGRPPGGIAPTASR